MSSYIVLLNANNKHYGSGRDAYESGGAYVSAKTSTSFTIDSQNNNGFSYQIIEFNPDFIGVIYGTNTTGSSTVTHNIGNLNYFVILNANADNVSAGEDSYASSGAYISDKSINSFTVTSYRCKHGLSYQIVYLK